jgi:hypothetical protein
MFHPFSLRHGDDTEYEAAIDWSDKTVAAVRGTEKLSESLSFEFMGGER